MLLLYREMAMSPVLKRGPMNEATLTVITSWQVIEHLGRKQPFTVWHHGQVYRFCETLEAAKAYIERHRYDE